MTSPSRMKLATLSAVALSLASTAAATAQPHGFFPMYVKDSGSGIGAHHTATCLKVLTSSVVLTAETFHIDDVIRVGGMNDPCHRLAGRRFRTDTAAGPVGATSKHPAVERRLSHA